jgi:hypothetical protein
MMAAEQITDASTGTYVFMLLLAAVLSLWPLAVLTNFRGYRDRHAQRALEASRRPLRWGRPPSSSPSESDRRFATAMQFVVAIVFQLAAAALIVVALVQLAARAGGG